MREEDRRRKNVRVKKKLFNIIELLHLNSDRRTNYTFIQQLLIHTNYRNNEKERYNHPFTIAF